MSSSAQSTAVASSISKLTIDPSKQTSSTRAQNLKAKKQKMVVDSWEDADLSSSADEGEIRPTSADQSNKAGTSAPPPTPVSPNYHNMPPQFSPSVPSMPPGVDGDGPARRPEKTDAVARRMIASALGVKVPRQTDEQKAYDKALRETERKRRDEERMADKKKQDELDKAKKAIWED